VHGIGLGAGIPVGDVLEVDAVVQSLGWRSRGGGVGGVLVGDVGEVDEPGGGGEIAESELDEVCRSGDQGKDLPGEYGGEGGVADGGPAVGGEGDDIDDRGDVADDEDGSSGKPDRLAGEVDMAVDAPDLDLGA